MNKKLEPQGDTPETPSVVYLTEEYGKYLEKHITTLYDRVEILIKRISVLEERASPPSLIT